MSNQNEMLSVINSLFKGGQSSFTLNSGRVVCVRTVKVKQLQELTELFSLLLDRLPAEKFDYLIREIANHQQLAKSAGIDPNEIDFNSVDSLVARAFGNSSVLLTAVSGMIDILPRFTSIFTDLKEDELGNLELDELIVVIVGIVGVNYRFFTQSLRPILSALLTEGGKQKAAMLASRALASRAAQPAAT